MIPINDDEKIIAANMVRHWAGTENNSPDLRLQREIDDQIGSKSVDEQNEAKNNNINHDVRKEKGASAAAQRPSYATILQKKGKIKA